MSDVLSSRPDLCGSEAVGADVAHVLDVVPHHNITHPADRERGSLVIGNGFLVADASFVADYGAIGELSHRARPAGIAIPTSHCWAPSARSPRSARAPRVCTTRRGGRSTPSCRGSRRTCS